VTTRHRYVGKPGSPDAMCGRQFSGSGFCGLPYVADWHYNDGDHPFTPADGREGECGWVLQGRAMEGYTCAGDDIDDAHTRPQPVNLLTNPVNMTMEYPKEESPVQNERTQEWSAGHVYPPSDDGGAPVTFPEPPTEVLQAPRLKDSLGLAPQNTADEQPEWSRAADYLRAPSGALLYGPWPMRKFILPDMPGISRPSDSSALERLQKSLEALETDYCLTVTRAKGAAYRVAWLTWDWAYGYTLEVACDELAAMYG
jgi:hypothetical protein